MATQWGKGLHELCDALNGDRLELGLLSVGTGGEPACQPRVVLDHSLDSRQDEFRRSGVSLPMGAEFNGLVRDGTDGVPHGYDKRSFFLGEKLHLATVNCCQDVFGDP